MSPSLFVLGWMSIMSCLLGTSDRMPVIASVASCLLAILLEAGSMDAGRTERGKAALAAQLVSLLAFLVRLAAYIFRP